MIGKLVVVLLVCCLFVVPVVSGLEVVVSRVDDGSRFSAEYGVGVSGVDGAVVVLCLVICIGIFVGVFEGFRGSLSR